MQKDIENHPILKKILDQIAILDFVIEKGGKEARAIMQKLISIKDEQMAARLQKKLDKFMPTEDQKYVIIMENLLRKAEMIDLGLVSTNNFNYFFNFHYWESCETPLLTAFLGTVAEFSGI